MKLLEKCNYWKINFLPNQMILQTCIDKYLLMISVLVAVVIERNHHQTFSKRLNNDKKVRLDSSVDNSKTLLFLAVVQKKVSLSNRFKKFKQFRGPHRRIAVKGLSNARNQKVILMID